MAKIGMSAVWRPDIEKYVVTANIGDQPIIVAMTAAAYSRFWRNLTTKFRFGRRVFTVSDQALADMRAKLAAFEKSKEEQC